MSQINADSATKMEGEATARSTKILLGVWLLLLVPWLFFAPLSAMVFDAGYTFDAYLLVWSVWTYPIMVLAAALLRKKKADFVFLPLINFSCRFSSLWLNPAAEYPMNPADERCCFAHIPFRRGSKN